MQRNFHRPLLTMLLCNAGLAVAQVHTAPIESTTLQLQDRSTARHAMDAIASRTVRQGFVPYWYTDDNTPAILDIVNRNHDTIDRNIELYAHLDGQERVSLGTVNLPWAIVQRISITERLRERGLLRDKQQGTRWGTGERAHSAWGSLVIEGADIENVSAWMLMTNQTESVGGNVILANSHHGATELLVQWWRPTAATTVAVAIQNVSDQMLVADVTLELKGTTHTNTLAPLAPGQAHLLDLAALADKLGVKPVPAHGHLRITTNRPAVARAFAFDATTGFSTPLLAHRIADRITNDLQNPGAPLGAVDDFPAGTVFHPTLILTNVTGQPLTADVFLQGEIPGSYQPQGLVVERKGRLFERRYDEDNGGIVEIPVSDWTERLATRLQLAPKETRIIDLFRYTTGEIVSQQIGVRVVADDAPVGAMVADLVVVDESLTYSFFDPMFDTGIKRPDHFAISFDLRETKNTHLLFKNTSDSPGYYNYSIYYAGTDNYAHWYHGQGVLGAQELAIVDIKQLRDLRVPDEEGHQLPSDLGTGFVTMTTSGHVVTADPTFDVVHGTCESCTQPVPGPKPRRRRWVTYSLVSPLCDPIFKPEGVFYKYCHYLAAGESCARARRQAYLLLFESHPPSCIKRRWVFETCRDNPDYVHCFPDSPIRLCSQ